VSFDIGREFCGRTGLISLRDLPASRRDRALHHAVKRPQLNGIVKRFHRTFLDERFRVEGRKAWFEAIEHMQAVLDKCLVGL
jgi:transposase InsO family protein